MVRRPLLLALLCAVPVLVAQPPIRSSPPVVAYSLALLGNEAARKELKLDADQAKKATALA
ncbi:MAG: hypothetical protein K2W96_22040, partial [Gemmataceae bacterium]|nr:hypothetical protein [Gemmataceae bacterium]